jgi:type IV pilus assembly protein PilY1
VTSSDPSKWAVRSKAIFKTPSGQPITTALSVSTLKSIQTNFSLAGKVLDNKPEKVMINFGTGQQTPASLTNGTTYSSTQQALYGVWDWDLSSWNSHNPAPSQQVVSLSSGPQPIAFSSLVSKQFTTTTSGGAIYRTVNTTPPSDVCWPPTPGFANGPSNPVNGSGCSGTGTNYGWYMNLSTTNSLYEQVVFDPVVNSDGMFIVNTYIPTSNSPLNCTPGTSTGFTMALEPDSGYGAPPATGSSAHGYFVLNNGTLVDGIELNGIGTPSFISTGAQDGNQEFMLTQGPNGMATPTPINRHSVVAGQRLNWVQRR